MKALLYVILGTIASLQTAQAEDGLGLFGDVSGVSKKDLRNGEIHTEDIPNLLTGAIDFFMGIAGTIAIIFVIIGAYNILFGSLQSDTTKGKNTIIMALVGFSIASLSWFIIRLIIDNFS